MTTELAEKDGQLSTFRQKLLDMEQEEERLRTAATAAGEQLARRSRVMAEQVDRRGETGRQDSTVDMTGDSRHDSRHQMGDSRHDRR